MTQDEIIEMARQAGLDPDLWNYTDAFERFAVLVAQHERKRIAQKIEQLPFGDTAASFAVYVREA
jgi:ribosomal protein S12 methylthiotransferase accessory factor YcaO